MIEKCIFVERFFSSSKIKINKKKLLYEFNEFGGVSFD